MGKKLRHLLHKLLNRLTLTALFLLIELGWLFSLVTGLSRHAVWIAPLFTAISLLIILSILRKDVNPAYKLGWVLLIALIPVFGWLMYAVFGNKTLSRRMHRRITAVEQQHPIDALPPTEARAAALPPRTRATATYLARCGGAEAYENTDVRYFALGDLLFPSLLDDLERAERFIFLEYFILTPGSMLDALLDVLRRKAAQGLDVRIIYDDFGCQSAEMVAFVHKAAQWGIRALPFNPIIPIFSIVMNHRDHRKITVIDGEIAYTGGINIADEYINQKERFGHWKDTGLRLQGDAVDGFTRAFLNLWNAFRKTDEDYAPFLRAASYRAKEHAPILVQPYFDSPLDNENVGENVYLDILAQAERYVYIFTPYLVIDAELQTALCNAAKRGVDVRIVTPGIPDKKSVFMLTRSYYPVLRRAGVKIYEYTPGFLHAKSFVCDDKIAVVGTVNLDYRSLYLHFECGTVFYGGDALEALLSDCRATMEQSAPIESLEFGRARGFGRGIRQALLRAFAPLL